MPVLSAADVSFLEGGRPIVQRDDHPVVDLMLGQDPAHEFRFGIPSHGADQANLPAQCPQHRRHARRPAQPVLPLIGSQQRHRRFLADPFGIAPDVAVQDQITDDHDPRLAQVLHATDQVMSHAAVPCRHWIRA